MLRKNFFLALSLLTVGLLPAEEPLAQTPDKLPPFGMLLSSGRYFSAADIPKEKPVLLIYFAPDCDHCHTLMNAFFSKAAAFARAEVVMVTHRPLAEVADFERKFGTAQFANIKVGSEGSSNFLRLFFKLQDTPFVALYDPERKLVSSYRKDPPVTVLLQQLKHL